MDFFTRNRTAGWIIAILVILNLALLVTIWYPRLNPEKKETVEPVEPGIKDKQGTGKDNRIKRSQRLVRFLEKELNFTREQGDKFLKLREEHFQKVEGLGREINDLRKEMMDHLLEKEPDMQEVERLAVEIGQKMSEHEKTVFYHFQELMDICDGEQKEKYRLLLRDILHQLAPPREHPPQEHAGPVDHQPPPGRRETGTDKQEQDMRGLRDRMPPPGRFDAENHLEHLRDQLGLTGSQVEKIRPVLEAVAEKLEKIHSDLRYRSREERREAREQVHRWEDRQIEALLTDQQKIRYRQIKERRKRRLEGPPGLR